MMLKKDYKKCEEIIKKNSKTFYQAFSMLKDIDQRNAVYAVYAYCRYSDDITDELKSAKAITDLREKLVKAINTKEGNDYIFRTLIDVSKKFYPKDYDFKPFFDMLLGHEMDLNKTKYETLDELFVYCKRVASSVGEMLIYILSPNGDIKILKQVALELGIAMQITNILRDIGEDYQNDRIYIPNEIMKRFGLEEKMIKNQEINEQFKKTFDFLANVAYEYYELAYQKLDVFPSESKQILSYALFLYKEIIVECKNMNYDVFSKKNHVSKQRKIEIIKEINAYGEF